MGPVYLVIFCYWVGPVPYLELFGAGPVEKNTLYSSHLSSTSSKHTFKESYVFPLVTNKQTYGKFGCGEAQEENKQNFVKKTLKNWQYARQMEANRRVAADLIHLGFHQQKEYNYILMKMNDKTNEEYNK